MSPGGGKVEASHPPEDRARRIHGLHAGIAGFAWGATAFVGSSFAIDGSTAVPEWVAVIAVSALAFAIGVWASAPGIGVTDPRIRDRWLAAGALTAIGASYGTFVSPWSDAFPDIPWKIIGLLLCVAIPAYAIGRIPAALVTATPEFDADDDPSSIGRFTAGTIVPAMIVGLVASLLVVALAVPADWGRGSVLMLVAALLLLPLVIRAPTAVGPEERILVEVGSPLGVWTVTEVVYPGERQPERRLYLNEEEESGELARSGAPTLAYVSAAEQWLVTNTPPGADYLFLGGGAYTLPRRIAERDASSAITVVELDPEATRLAQRYFGLKSHHGIRSVHADARAWLESDALTPVDRVYVDVYGGREMIPYSLVTREAAARIASALRPGGVMGMNVIGTLGGKEAAQFWSVIRTFGEVFPAMELWAHRGRDFPDPQNFLLVASTAPIRQGSLALGTFEHWPRDEWPDEEGTAVFHDLPPAERALPIPRVRLGADS